MSTTTPRPRGGALLLAALASCLALAACGDDAETAAPPPPAGPSARTASPARPAGGPPTAATANPTPAQLPDITLAFAGDIHFARQLEPLVDDSAAAWADRLPQLAAADLAMANLETAIATGGSPAVKKYTFRTPPKALDALDHAGIDVLSMANNHAADYGATGVRETLAAIAHSPVPVVGFGKDGGAAFAPVSYQVKGIRVGVLAATQLTEETVQNWSAGDDHPGVATAHDPTRLRAAVRAAVKQHDVVVVYLHWGTEGDTCPNDAQRTLARQLADDGADIVVGTHAHRPQGSGMLGRTFVGYGLGNYVWYNASPGSRSSGVLTLKVSGAAVTARRAAGGHTADTPALVSARTWTPRVITGEGLPVAPRDSAAALDRAARDADACSGLSGPGRG